MRREPTADAPVVVTRAPVAVAPPPIAGSSSVASPSPGTSAEPSDEESIVAPAAVAPESPYPPGSQPLTEGSDPATAPPEDDPVDPDSGMHVVFGPRWDVVHPPDPIVIDVQLLDKAGKRLRIRDGRVFFRTERDTNRSGAGAHVAIVDDGTGADRVKNDLSYTATFAPGEADRALLDFRVFVELELTIDGTGQRRYVTWVEYTPKPHGYLDGRYADAAIAGSLIVQAGVTITAGGRFKVIGSLYAADKTTAIAFAQTAVELGVGAHEIPLMFFGKILHDRGIDGPYVVRYAMLFEEFPERGVYWPGVTVDTAYTTGPYRAAAFAPDAFVAPATTEPAVTAQSPSQRDKPPPLFKR